MKKRNSKALAFSKKTIANPIRKESLPKIIAGYANQNANQNEPAKEAKTYEYSPCILYTVYIGDAGCPTTHR